MVDTIGFRIAAKFTLNSPLIIAVRRYFTYTYVECSNGTLEKSRMSYLDTNKCIICIRAAFGNVIQMPPPIILFLFNIG